MNKVEKYVQEAISIANNNSHGYSQASRWGTPDYDCSSLVISVVQNAGIPVKDYGSTFTGNMYPAFRACGFDDVTGQVNLYNGAGLQRGDILLNDVNHTAIYIGNGQIVHARGSDGHPEPGDQTGREIVSGQGYWNYPWDHVLRYGGGSEPQDLSQRTYLRLEIGDGIDNPLESVRAWQALLLIWGYYLGSSGADGEFGGKTYDATVSWQTFARDSGLPVEVNGIVDEDDWQEIINVPVEDAK